MQPTCYPDFPVRGLVFLCALERRTLADLLAPSDPLNRSLAAIDADRHIPRNPTAPERLDRRYPFGPRRPELGQAKNGPRRQQPGSRPLQFADVPSPPARILPERISVKPEPAPCVRMHAVLTMC